MTYGFYLNISSLDAGCGNAFHKIALYGTEYHEYGHQGLGCHGKHGTPIGLRGWIRKHLLRQTDRVTTRFDQIEQRGKKIVPRVSGPRSALANIGNVVEEGDGCVFAADFMDKIAENSYNATMNFDKVRSNEISSKDMERLLSMLGVKVLRQNGSHRFYSHEDGRCTVVPFHNSDLKRGLIKAI